MWLEKIFKSKANLTIASLSDLLLFFLQYFLYTNINKINFSIFSCFIFILSWLLISYFLGRYQPFGDIKYRKMSFLTLKKLSLTFFFTNILLFLFSNLKNFESNQTLSNNQFFYFCLIFCTSSFALQEILVKFKINFNNEIKNVLVYLGPNAGEKINIPKELFNSKNNVRFIKFENLNQLKTNIDEMIIVNLNELEYISVHFQSLIQRGVSIYKLIEWNEKYLKKIPSYLIDVESIFTGKWRAQSKSIEMRMKRFGDIFIGFILLIVSSPVLLICGLIIKLQDGGPIFYKQIRTGLWGNEFTIIKLRTMIINAEKNGIRWSSANDARVTKFGRILRKYRIDELPQLLQVIHGEMSLIGPRPERPYLNKILTEKIPNYDLRCFIRPGLSGWAQINYPYGASIEDAREKLSYDIFYLKKFSFWLDLLIFFRTIFMLLRAKGSDPK